MFVWVRRVCGVISPICGMVVSKAQWSLYVVFIEVGHVCAGGELSGEVGTRRSHW